MTSTSSSAASTNQRIGPGFISMDSPLERFVMARNRMPGVIVAIRIDQPLDGRKASEKQYSSESPCSRKAGNAVSTIFAEPQT